MAVNQAAQVTALAARAKALRERELTRPLEAVHTGNLFVRLQKARRTGRQGDASKTGRATNRLPKGKRNREKVLAADKYGWFRETRRRERRGFVEGAGRRLLLLGVCKLSETAYTDKHWQIARRLTRSTRPSACTWPWCAGMSPWRRCPFPPSRGASPAPRRRSPTAR